MIKDGQRYIITTNAWFYAPDGEQYRGAWGTCHLSKIEDVFGFTPVRPSTNWYLTVGSGEHEIVIAGCQIHYAVRCEQVPEDKYRGKTVTDKDTGVEKSASSIYLAEPALPATEKYS
jgi:hypothetical protein